MYKSLENAENRNRPGNCGILSSEDTSGAAVEYSCKLATTIEEGNM